MEDFDGDITEHIEQQRQEIKDLVLDCESRKLIAQARKEYIKKLNEEYSLLMDSIESIQKKIIKLMDAGGVAKMDTPVGTVSIRVGSWSVAGHSIETLPPSCKRIKTIVEADKLLIRQLLSEGHPIDGWSLERGSSTLVIKR